MGTSIRRVPRDRFVQMHLSANRAAPLPFLEASLTRHHRTEGTRQQTRVPRTEINTLQCPEMTGSLCTQHRPSSRTPSRPSATKGCVRTCKDRTEVCTPRYHLVGPRRCVYRRRSLVRHIIHASRRLLCSGLRHGPPTPLLTIPTRPRSAWSGVVSGAALPVCVPESLRSAHM